MSLTKMPKPKEGISTENKKMHYSVGAIIKKDEKFLLIDRVKPPFGFAGLAGHIDENETPEEALKREVKEESGLDLKNFKILLEEEINWNECSKGIGVHYWHLYECEVEGEIKRNFEETKSIGWFTKEEILDLKLEPVWEYFFKKLKII